KCLKQGVVFKFFEEILDLKMTYQEIKAVVTNKETYYVDYVINCAGSYSKEIANMAGVDVPVYAEKHEILGTEPVKPILGPMVMSFSKNFYIQQVPHGPLIMGQGGKHLESNHDQTSTVEFLENISKTVLEVLPGIGNVRVQRQWAGSYDMSPDRSPIISKTDVKNLIVACGFSGRGFMIAPATGLLIKDLVLNQKSSIKGIDLKDLSLERFKNEL